MSEKILIIEDELRIVRTLRLYLEQAAFQVFAVHNGAQALPAYRQEQPALVLLDLNLPGRDGLEVCRALRQEGKIPIIMLTARSEENDRLIGFELGADDYIVKPFSPREVVARVRAVLRRTSDEGPADALAAGDLRLDLAGHRVWLGKQVLTLTQSEFDILAVLAHHQGQVLSRLQLLQATQTVAYEGAERTIDQHVKNLRRKLRTAGDVEAIETVYGVGYRLDPIHLSQQR